MALWLASFAAALIIGFTALLVPDLLVSRPAQAAESRAPLIETVGVNAPKGCSKLGCDHLVEMEVKDVVPLNAADSHAVVLVAKEGGTVLPIFVDESSAVAIAFRLAHRDSPHPLAQDLLDSVVEKMGGQVTEVRIDEVDHDIFHGRLFIAQGDKKLELDARPSDSIAMALTKGAKIFATEKVLVQAGITKAEIDRLRNHAQGNGPGVGGSGDEGMGPMDGDEAVPQGKGTEIQL